MNLAKNKARNRKKAYIFIKKNLSSAKMKYREKKTNPREIKTLVIKKFTVQNIPSLCSHVYMYREINP